MGAPRPAARSDAQPTRVAMLAGGRASGGTAYEDQVADALAPVAAVDRPHLPGAPLRRLLELRRLRGDADVWIRDHAATAMLQRRRTRGATISLLHHIDNSVKRPARRAASALLDVAWRRNIGRVEAAVAVSRHWAGFLADVGVADVTVIHNMFDPAEFEVTKEEVAAFRRRHGLGKRPIVYLGNCQRAKGVVHAYQALRGMDAHLVTSGARKVDVPSLNLDLPRRDYACLLRASSVVVTMSLFDEGWCRTAHEAMLAGVPVVGSGRGGMAELLEGGGQVVCRDFTKLRRAVEAAQGDAALGQSGRLFAARPEFQAPAFVAAWQSLVRRLVDRQAP